MGFTNYENIDMPRKKQLAAETTETTTVPTTPTDSQPTGAPKRLGRKISKPEQSIAEKATVAPAAVAPASKPAPIVKEESSGNVGSSEEPKGPRRGFRSKREIGATPTPISAPTKLASSTDDDLDLPIPTFRSREPGRPSRSSEKPAPPQQPVEAEVRAETRPVRGKLGRSKPAPETSEKPIQKEVAKVSAPAFSPSEVDADLDDVQLSFRPRTASAPAAKPAREVKPREVVARDDRKVEKAPAVALAPIEEFLSLDIDLPAPVWREKTEGPTDSEEPKNSERDGDRRRSRNNRRGEKAEKPVTVSPNNESDELDADAPSDDDGVVPAFRPKLREKPKSIIPPRALIEIPEAAPQVIVRNGQPTLVKGGKVYPPFFFAAEPSDDARISNVLDEVKQAAEAGVHLFLYRLDVHLDENGVDAAARRATDLVRKTLEVDPQAQVAFRIRLDFAGGWDERYPNAVYRMGNGRIGRPSLSDDAIWHDAISLLVRFTKSLRASNVASSLLGLHLDGGIWFQSTETTPDRSPAAQDKFRAWVRERYVNDDVMLQASWFDGSAKFEDIILPKVELRKEDRSILLDRKQRPIVDAMLFYSDQTMARIADVSYALKEASEGWFLIGLEYGLSLEHPHPNSSHLSLGKVLRTPEIDFISAPSGYSSREPGQSAPFATMVDSFALNGKLFFSELDYKTSLARGTEPDTHNAMLRTPQALESVHNRDLGGALAHSAGLIWSDTFGNGWLTANSVWERAAKSEDVLVRRMAADTKDPEVAVFLDERTLAYVNDQNAFKTLLHSLREAVLRAGVSVGFYLISDLAHRERFPETKLNIFVNAWDIRSDLRAAIKTRLQRDGKVLAWIYAGGLFDSGRDSLERVREVTGIAIKPQPIFSKPGTTILDRRHPLASAFPTGTIQSEVELSPTYFAIPEDGHVIGEYTQSGLPSFVVRNVTGEMPDLDWTSVFLGEATVNSGLIRALAQMAGAHIWSHSDDVVHVRPPFLTVHCSAEGSRAITMPNRWSAINASSGDWAMVDATNLRFIGIDGSNHTYYVGPKEELQAMLEQNPNELLKITELPPRDSNIRVDATNFDVPIVRLDEFMNGFETEDSIDEWFLRPVEEQAEESTEDEVVSEVPGRSRRRRRRGGRGRDRQDIPADATVENYAVGDDFDMPVVFRRKD